MKCTILVTGIRGTLGQLIESVAAEAGCSTVGLRRSELDNGWTRSLKKTKLVRDAPPNDVLVHAAIPPNPRSARDYFDYEDKSIALFEEANKLQIRLIFVSSMSVHPDNHSRYVKHKLRLEEHCLRLGGGVVRFGLIPSSSEGSSFSSITKVSNFLPEKFLVRPNALFFITGPEHLKQWILDGMRCAANESNAEICICASQVPLTLRMAVGRGLENLPTSNMESKSSIFVRCAEQPRRIIGLVDSLMNLRAGMARVTGTR